MISVKNSGTMVRHGDQLSYLLQKEEKVAFEKRHHS
jgi:hypothetical protein